MPRTITVGVDGSPGSLVAVDWAVREARYRDVPLRLVHAVRHPAEADRSLSEAEARIARRHPDLRIDSDRVAADPVSALLAAAEDAELVVLGSHGPGGGVAGLLAGSVALAVAGRSRRPVVLVPGGHHQGEHRTGGPGMTSQATAYSDVVLGLDLKDPHEAVIELAFDAASRRAARLRVVHGWSPEPYAPDGGGTWQSPAADGHSLCELLDPWREKFPGVEVAAQAVIGTAGTHLAEASADASLVVVGRAERRMPVGAAIGPVAQVVLEHSSAPVAVVPRV
ncbi:universal stress protein [Streptomyces yaanensis]|uniref:Universal stress protein n=1 Tax=Streptomyces yaanensis TaxID=1142239 RepID=A0ABV7S4G1_9ACTN|nr:universal stress protein [Streptomyces sp. CGMCC 4.7035]WNB99573.1 universal stress protein [Streptomyces sp. CGMCC 4.7035]